ncbi:MAG TPA: hypothetical protein VNC16_03185 [Solirubrobacterales bacterium]|jgi:hypothetical protein|nr:hypothetical protein [Solirubrobacterales bacterium]
MPETDSPLARLSRLRLPDDVEEIIGLDPPGSQLADDLGDAEFRQLALVRKLWCSLAEPGPLLEVLVRPADDSLGDDRFWALFSQLGVHYSHYAIAASAADPMTFFRWMSSEQCVDPGETPDLDGRFENLDAYANKPLSDEDHEFLTNLRIEAIRRMTSSKAAADVKRFDRSQLALMISHAAHKLSKTSAEVAQLDFNLEATIFGDLKSVNDDLRDLQGPAQAMVEYQLGQLLAYGEFIYVEHPARGKTAEDSVFSDRWLIELTEMARRDDRLRKIYGQKQLANQYERNLALLFQSLGFVTVPALSGEEAADLLCIGKGEDERFTFLVDAKSSKSPYSFPKSDQRALSDYVRQTKRSLSDLPALRCVLLVGNGPAGTVGDKLAALTATVDLPLRFISTGNLVHLRKESPGPVPPSFFLKMLLDSDPVIARADLDRLLERQSSQDRAYADFVREMRSISSS